MTERNPEKIGLDPINSLKHSRSSPTPQKEAVLERLLSQSLLGRELMNRDGPRLAEAG